MHDPVKESLRQRPAAQTDGARPTSAISIDLACANCGYNLRGLDLSAACPECSTPIERTLIALSRNRVRRHAAIRPISIGLLAASAADLALVLLLVLIVRLMGITNHDLEYPGTDMVEGILWLLRSGGYLAVAVFVSSIVTGICAFAANDRRSHLYCIISVPLSLSYLLAALFLF